MDRVYRWLKPLLFTLDPETAHGLVLGVFGRCPRLYPNRLSQSIRDVGDVVWQGPVGLAAGADKGGHALLLWERLGFGSVEIGTVLPRPQVGNPRPRVHRLSDHKAVVNAMGFPSEGMDVVHARLARYMATDRWPRIPVGINVSKNKDTPDYLAHEDCVAVVRKLKNFADWITVNVSSPNTPGLRDLQKAEALRRILDPVLAEAGIPVFVKFSPDMSDGDLEGAVEAAKAAGVSGIIATNTTISRPVASAHKGGMSGAPLFSMARGNIERIRTMTDLPLVGVGGVDSPEKAADLLRLGCAGIQLYTGLIYEGPGLVNRINRLVGLV